MILLRANQELRQTFEKLIETMKVPVQWNGIFAVIDNYIILQGEVRSLFFHFDSKKVVTNIIDIPVKEEIMEDTGSNVHVRNVINMILYAFGKWGRINGLKVEKNYAQLNRLFMEVLREIGVEPEYDQEHFSFYKDGIRVTYEDVIQFALEYEEEAPVEEDERGLWYNLVWKKKQADFVHVETELSERLRGRLGNNFYMVGYLCPSCREKLHMVVYPVGKEFRIETEEGTVLLARAAVCDHCNCFYTPRPGKLFSEGDVYTMQFEDDRKAYEDYLELIGKGGARISNHRFNEFADKRRAGTEGKEAETAEKELEEFCENLAEHSEEEVEKIRKQIEEGFYPDEDIRKLERKIKAYRRQKNQWEENRENAGHKKENADRRTDFKQSKKSPLRMSVSSDMTESIQEAKPAEVFYGDDRIENIRETKSAEASYGGGRTTESIRETRHPDRIDDIEETAEASPDKVSAGEQEEIRRKYEAKIKVCDRFSERQRKEFKEQLLHEKRLEPAECRKYVEQVEKQFVKGRMEQLSKKADACEGKPYVIIKRVFEDIQKEDIPQKTKQPLLDKLQEQMKQQGEREVRQLMTKMPPNLNRAGYRQFVEKIHAYEGINLAPYEEQLHNRREMAERREMEELVKRARKITREDYKELAKRLEEGDFLPELMLPYREKIDEKIRQLDADEIAKICLNPQEMSFEEGMLAYEKIEKGDFLPELKADALKMLARRLSKIKTDECELLVRKLKTELQKAGIAETPKHHFYPARRVLMEETNPEETEVIDFAMASYAAGNGLFEYPILVVDTSRNGTGKEGMILTPDHLYYSTLLSAYGIPIASIRGITASTGLLSRGIYVHEKNGTKTKIPYAVAAKELPDYADILDEFIHYLQEKPESRKLDYLAEEKHERICCFRCGYAYRGGAVCPKCGYKNNE